MASLLYVARPRRDYGLLCVRQGILRRIRKLKRCLELMSEFEWTELWPLKRGYLFLMLSTKFEA